MISFPAASGNAFQVGDISFASLRLTHVAGAAAFAAYRAGLSNSFALGAT